MFAFVNRRGPQIKVLYFDRSGWCVWAKRLECQPQSSVRSAHSSGNSTTSSILRR
ncbi:IS66 family insertion sequence element accessory protein TnpB [Roseateles sp.]|uniref:IS66 family insertion sequence element accessory protein TnpB n=1 Tax=Roseateles sp. TaxID=1971397 RepID=UPI0039C9680C